jgi:hypothetical protein
MFFSPNIRITVTINAYHGKDYPCGVDIYYQRRVDVYDFISMDCNATRKLEAANSTAVTMCYNNFNDDLMLTCSKLSANWCILLLIASIFSIVAAIFLISIGKMKLAALQTRQQRNHSTPIDVVTSNAPDALHSSSENIPVTEIEISELKKITIGKSDTGKSILIQNP